MYSMWRWNIKQGTNINWLNICFDRSVDREHPDKQKNIICRVNEADPGSHQWILIYFEWEWCMVYEVWPYTLYSLQDWGHSLDWNDFRFRTGHKDTRPGQSLTITTCKKAYAVLFYQTNCLRFHLSDIPPQKDMVCFKNKFVAVAPFLGLEINLLI